MTPRPVPPSRRDRRFRGRCRFPWSCGLAAVVAALPADGAAAARPVAAVITLSYRVVFHLKDGAVDVVGESWTFSDAYSNILLAEYDQDGDGDFSATETAAIRDRAFSRLSGARGLTYLSVDGRDLGAVPPSGFRAIAVDGVVTVAFGLRLPTPVDPRRATLDLEIRDPDFTVYALPAARDPILVRGAGSAGCTGRAESDPANAYFDGMIVPTKITLVCGP